MFPFQFTANCFADVTLDIYHYSLFKFFYDNRKRSAVSAFCIENIRKQMRMEKIDSIASRILSHISHSRYNAIRPISFIDITLS